MDNNFYLEPNQFTHINYIHLYYMRAPLINVHIHMLDLKVNYNLSATQNISTIAMR